MPRPDPDRAAVEATLDETIARVREWMADRDNRELRELARRLGRRPKRKRRNEAFLEEVEARRWAAKRQGPEGPGRP